MPLNNGITFWSSFFSLVSVIYYQAHSGGQGLRGKIGAPQIVLELRETSESQLIKLGEDDKGLVIFISLSRSIDITSSGCCIFALGKRVQILRHIWICMLVTGSCLQQVLRDKCELIYSYLWHSPGSARWLEKCGQEYVCPLMKTVQCQQCQGKQFYSWILPLHVQTSQKRDLYFLVGRQQVEYIE